MNERNLTLPRRVLIQMIHSFQITSYTYVSSQTHVLTWKCVYLIKKSQFTLKGSISIWTSKLFLICQAAFSFRQQVQKQYLIAKEQFSPWILTNVTRLRSWSYGILNAFSKKGWQIRVVLTVYLNLNQLAEDAHFKTSKTTSFGRVIPR